MKGKYYVIDLPVGVARVKTDNPNAIFSRFPDLISIRPIFREDVKKSQHEFADLAKIKPKNFK